MSQIEVHRYSRTTFADISDWRRQNQYVVCTQLNVDYFLVFRGESGEGDNQIVLPAPYLEAFGPRH